MPFAHPALHRRMEVARPKLFRTAFAWCRDRHLAEDLVQETLAKAMSKVGQLKSNDALEGWLFKIMANLWRDHVRRDRPMDTMEDVDVRNEETPEDLHSQHQTVAQVRKALGELPDNYRIALTLVDIEGFSYAETAGIMDVPVGTVMSRLSRGRNQLAKILKESGGLSGTPAGAPHVKRVK